MDLTQLSDVALRDLEKNGNDPRKWSDQTLQEIDAQHAIAEAKAQKIGVGSGESASRGLANEATFGFADEISGALRHPLGAAKQALTHVGANFDGDKDVANYKRERDIQRSIDEEASSEHPIAYGAGQVGGALTTGLAGGAGLAKAGLQLPAKAGIARTAVQSALEGGVFGGISGAGNSKEDLLKDYSEGATTGMLTGGVLGTAGNLAGRALGSSGQVLDDASNKWAGYSAVKGKGNVKKIDAQYGDVGSFGKKLKEANLVGAGDNARDIAEKAELAREHFGSQIGDIIKSIDNQTGGQSVDTAQMARRLQSEINFARTNPETNAVADSLQKDLDRFMEFYREKPGISLQELGQYKKSLSDKYWANPADKSPDVVAGRNFARQIGDMMENKVEEIGMRVPDAENLLGAYKAAKEKFGTAATADKMLKDQVAGMDANRFFSPSDYFSGGAGAMALGPQGVALAAVNKLARERGASTTSSILGHVADTINATGEMSQQAVDAIAKLVQAQPQALGKYRQALESAAARGGASLAVTHGLLMKDPEYKDLVMGRTNP